ncbi:hypothetical protein K1719_007699 [Acacia pycnantha]|nr:hypothetical protein K1719_007699 [Acacia pycnantha]
MAPPSPFLPTQFVRRCLSVRRCLLVSTTAGSGFVWVAGKPFVGSAEEATAYASPTLPAETSSSPPSVPPVTGMARPIRLVYCDEKGKFRMDPEAVTTLQLVKEPIGVIFVCGQARQGKSFILNQFRAYVVASKVDRFKIGTMDLKVSSMTIRTTA